MYVKFYLKSYETSFVEELTKSFAPPDHADGCCSHVRLVTREGVFSFVKPSKNDVIETFDSVFESFHVRNVSFERFLLLFFFFFP